MTAPTRRTNFIRVRLSPKPAPAMAMTADDEERQAIEAAAVRNGFDQSLSAFLRHVGWHAAAVVSRKTDADEAFREAAAAAGMGVGEWMRHVVLATIGYTSLVEQIEAAKKAVK